MARRQSIDPVSPSLYCEGMKDSALKLQDKTVFLTGAFNGTVQAILRSMTEFGADVAYVSDQTPSAQTYVNGVNEAREVHPHYGRAAFFNLPLGTEEQITEAMGKIAESFGRLDILIDAAPLSWTAANAEAGLKASGLLAERVLPFLKAKQKGRIVYIFEDAALQKLKPTTLPEAQREALLQMVQSLALKTLSMNVTVNALALGVTEDFLLKQFPGNPSIRKTLEQLQTNHPGIKLLESTEIALGAAYAASALSASLTGQVLKLTHGFHLTQTST